MADPLNQTTSPSDEWADLALYDRCLAEGLKAQGDWRTVRSDCPYPPDSPARSAWMDGYDAR